MRFGPAEAEIKALAEQEANRSIAAALAAAPVGVSDPSDLTGYGVPDPAIVWWSQHRSAILEAAHILAIGPDTLEILDTPIIVRDITTGTETSCVPYGFASDDDRWTLWTDYQPSQIARACTAAFESR